ncbi:putative deaminase [Candidatus Jidaibacter acanthamoeba]|uniref:tRNA-specific adenosine deaminase n=1 Tax=Candidatus Jidaibacter acanthamoebae TaxID=86105 RepID=A0A0C1MSJ5_9RICK|nr:nucleoside deaminase [Candidatus Jidaibacter acanthamoeba]KIE05007.1 putative deaminase [Candidatus Jidaibacter acanthamoeba]
MFSNQYMQQAYALACKANDSGEVPVGAVVVYKEKIIGAAYNQVEVAKNPLAHAEILALEQALAFTCTKYIEQCELYVTLEPCPMCAHAISLAKIKRIYFGAYDEKGGGVVHGAKIYNSSSCHHHPEIISGIMEDECSRLLKNFFNNLRR